MRLLRAIWAAISRVHRYEARNQRRRERFLRLNNYQLAIRKWFGMATLVRRKRRPR